MLAENLLTGKVVLSHGAALGLANLSPPELQTVNAHLKEASMAEDMDSYIKSLLPAKRRPPILPKPAVSVKDMPGYDPDSEIASLTLTIPSWRGSIQRIMDTADFKATSDKAQDDASRELLALKVTINAILGRMKGVSYNG